MAAITTFKIKRNDRLPSIGATLKDVLGPINLTYATVHFHMTDSVDGTAKVNAAATVVDANDGRVRYDWGTTDTNLAGTYFAEWEITYPDTKTLTVPNDSQFKVIITPDVA